MYLRTLPQLMAYDLEVYKGVATVLVHCPFCQRPHRHGFSIVGTITTEHGKRYEHCGPRVPHCVDDTKTDFNFHRISEFQNYLIVLPPKRINPVIWDKIRIYREDYGKNV